MGCGYLTQRQKSLFILRLRRIRLNIVMWERFLNILKPQTVKALRIFQGQLFTPILGLEEPAVEHM